MGIIIKVRVGMRYSVMVWFFVLIPTTYLSCVKSRYLRGNDDEAPRQSNGTIFKGQKYVKRDHGLLSKITRA